ncbi:patatin-like phospholipase family protein [Chryseolinea sp. H1M3-3]|uniref:patatin-like phospholipase family protein n=1 Tax=Chryseolinea sp. H1M3-3 TaxID=3034144 RepID=UPI0023ECF842|nr:patatin-like phospholipase family protein [Chryseolinea sp. H1M3-3]
MRKFYYLYPKIVYSFPVQLLLNNFQRNLVLMLCWFVLFALISGSFGQYLGIPYLFLDPEYLHKVNFTSFFIIGMVTGGFTTAFHITCYITDGHRFSFIGSMRKPFTKFVINNSVVPVAFLITYIFQIIKFQINNEYVTRTDLISQVGGLMAGYLVMTSLLSAYFWFTNNDIFKYVVCRIDEKLKTNVRATRKSVMKKLDIVRKKQVRVDNYLDYDFKFKNVKDTTFYNKASILQVFDQNHFNLVIIELFIFGLVLILGILKDHPAFQLPAASTFIIFLTIFVMLSGAFSYWFGNWASTTAVILFLVFNHLVGENYLSRRYEAFGLNYLVPPVEYTIKTITTLNDTIHQSRDRRATLPMLENWRKKFPTDVKPKMIFLCASGGGKRAALWALTALQTADSLTDGQLMKNSILITGASGGLIGASYFRELKLRDHYGEKTRPHSSIHRDLIATDNLNPIIFSLMANDLFVGFTKFEYNGNYYYKDRGYTFEEQLNLITNRMMDKPITAYDSAELKSVIPMMILSPTIVNDGRKLYIAARPVSFMNYDVMSSSDYNLSKLSGVDFISLFEDQNGEDLRFLSALRMTATFPYITPNTSLPSEPSIQIMDAGISDNFGLSDAIRFAYAYKDWIDENTSGIIFLSIRDSPKLGNIAPRVKQNIVDALTQPISNVYNNFENFQDINSDMQINHAKSWLKSDIDRIDLQYELESYVPILQKMDSLRINNPRASLSWRLTTREKFGIITSINSRGNQREIERLRKLLE